MERHLRKATLEDMDLLFVWANEPMVRKNSFITAEISYEEHVEWYHKLLKRNNCQQYIYVVEGEPVGQARITVDGETAEIGYSICAEERGMGHGRMLLQLLKKQVVQDFPEVKKLIGKVKTDNTASRKAFENAGYKEQYMVFEMEI